jgi:penicillin-binding protein 1A
VVLGLQEAAEQSVAWGLRRWPSRELQAALVAIDPRTGDVLAIVGGRDFKETAFNRAVRSRRQPGSAFKPFVYAAALERRFSPVTLLRGLDAIRPQGPEEWTPRNARYETPEELAIRTALIVSDNRAAVRLQQQIGSRAVLNLAEEAGLSDLPDVPSLALGTGVVTPLDLTAAYTIFPGGGQAVRPRAIIRVVDADGQTALQESVVRSQVISPQAAFQMVTLLADVVDRGTATSARSFGLTGPVAGKTGTTDDFKDAWFVGFSSSLVAGVWVGRDQPAPIGRDAYAARVALPIWSEFMRRAGRLRPAKPFAQPDGLHPETLCRVSYQLPVDGCPTYVEYFKRGDDPPSQKCRVHRASFGQQVRRTLEDAIEEIGKAIWGIIKR